MTSDEGRPPEAPLEPPGEPEDAGAGHLVDAAPAGPATGAGAEQAPEPPVPAGPPQAEPPQRDPGPVEAVTPAGRLPAEEPVRPAPVEASSGAVGVRAPGRVEALVSGWAQRMPAMVLPVTVEAVILAVLASIAFLAFLAIEPTPRWLALATAVVAALGTDGALRAARREPFASGADTTPYLFLPSLYALAAPVFLEYNVVGFWAVPAALAAGVGLGGIVVAEIASVRADEPLRAPARFYAASATYFVVFALFSLAYAFDVGLWPAIVAVALISMLLSVELLRDDQIDALETLVFAGVIGLVVGEARWVLQYMPVGGYLAGLTLLLLFYFATGVAHAYITRQLDRTVAAEYGAVALLGVALVVGVRIAGVA